MKYSWWKIMAIACVLYSIIAGFLIEVPRLPILNETIRNLFFHVTMWYNMIILLIVSLVYSIRFLGKSSINDDIVAEESARLGIFMGVLGIITGSIWAKNTWGAWWVSDPKLNGSVATMLVYLAYFLLRGSMDDEHKKARISSVYSIFAFTLMLVFILILPRFTDSLHPGNGGNPGFSTYDLDNNMRLVFYPAVIGWALLSVWILTIRTRIRKLTRILHN